MEGQYYYFKGQLNNTIRDKLLSEKEALRICSLSKVNNNELMWSHYANGHRGIAIGLKIDKSIYNVKQIKYTGIKKVNSVDFLEKDAAEILSHKLSVWQ